MQVSFHSGTYMAYVSRDVMMHDAVNAGLRIVYSKDMFFKVGLAHWQVIQNCTPEALEKVS